MAKQLVRKFKSCRNIRNIYENIWPTKKCSIKQQDQFKMASKPVFIKTKFHAVCIHYHLKQAARLAHWCASTRPAEPAHYADCMTSKRFAQARSARALSTRLYISVRPYKTTRRSEPMSWQALGHWVTKAAPSVHCKQPRHQVLVPFAQGASLCHQTAGWQGHTPLHWLDLLYSGSRCAFGTIKFRICGMAARQGGGCLHTSVQGFATHRFTRMQRSFIKVPSTQVGAFGPLGCLAITRSASRNENRRIEASLRGMALGAFQSTSAQRLFTVPRTKRSYSYYAPHSTRWLCFTRFRLSSGYSSKVCVSSLVHKRTTLPFQSAVLSDPAPTAQVSTLGPPSAKCEASLPLYVIRRALYRTRSPKSATQLKSIFRFQLQETKKLSLLYGNLSRKQIKKICHQAHTVSSDAFTESVFCLLERRLDVVLFRAGFCKSIFQARQWIHHKKIDINGRILTIPGYQCNPGDIISCTHQSFHHVCKHLENFYMTRMSHRASKPQGAARLWTEKHRAAHFINGTGHPQSVKDPRQNKPHEWLRSFRGYRTAPFSIRTLRMRSFAIPPLNLEVNYRNLTAVYLYSPQRIILPTFLDIYLVIRGLYRY